MLDALGVLCRTVPEERVNRREPHVASGGQIVALDFKIMKEVEDLLGADMLDIQLLRKDLPAVVAGLKRRGFDFDDFLGDHPLVLAWRVHRCAVSFSSRPRSRS